MSKNKKNKNILVLTYWELGEGLIQAYTIPYLKIILEQSVDHITLVTLEKKEHLSPSKNINGIEKLDHFPLNYFPFGVKAMLKWFSYLFSLVRFIKKNDIDVIHCWCTPAGAIGYLLSILTGKPLILDSYEPHAEAMVENGTWPANSLPFKILFNLEKRQTKMLNWTTFMSNQLV